MIYESPSVFKADNVEAYNFLSLLPNWNPPTALFVTRWSELNGYKFEVLSRECSCYCSFHAFAKRALMHVLESGSYNTASDTRIKSDSPGERPYNGRDMLLSPVVVNLVSS